jgi:hypothetical protein
VPPLLRKSFEKLAEIDGQTRAGKINDRFKSSSSLVISAKFLTCPLILTAREIPRGGEVSRWGGVEIGAPHFLSTGMIFVRVARAGRGAASSASATTL